MGAKKTSSGGLKTPLTKLQEDAAEKNTGSKKIQTAKQRTTAESRKQTRQKLAEQKQARIKRQQELQQYTLSKSDRKNLNRTGRQLVREAKAAWEAADDAGNQTAKAAAHAKAELVRKQYGYSGGKAGEEYLSPQLSTDEKARLNQTGQTELKKARMDYETAKRGGDKEGMKAAIRREAEIRKAMKYQNLGYSPIVGTDAHGRPIRAASQRDQMIGEAIGKGLVGSLLSLRETSRAAMTNYQRQRWSGDKTPVTVNPDALGQRLMRESQEAGLR